VDAVPRPRTPPDEAISIEVRQESGAQVVAVAGEIDIATEPRLRIALRRALEADAPGPVVVDLTAVVFIASTGLAALAHARRLAGQQGRLLRLVVDPGRSAAADPIMITGINQLIDTYDDLASAISGRG
jgi:anti-sigma B factor antagonist